MADATVCESSDDEADIGELFEDGESHGALGFAPARSQLSLKQPCVLDGLPEYERQWGKELDLIGVEGPIMFENEGTGPDQRSAILDGKCNRLRAVHAWGFEHLSLVLAEGHVGRRDDGLREHRSRPTESAGLWSVTASDWNVPLASSMPCHASSLSCLLSWSYR